MHNSYLVVGSHRVYLLLRLMQNMEYKFVELLSCQFQASSEEHVKQQVTYRYNAVKSRLALMQARLADINALVSHHTVSCCIFYLACTTCSCCFSWAMVLRLSSL